MFKKGDRVTTKAMLSWGDRKIRPGQLGTVHDPKWSGRYMVVQWDGIKALWMTLEKREIEAIVPASGR